VNAQKAQLRRFLQKFLSSSELEQVNEIVGSITAIEWAEGQRANEEAWRTGLKTGEIRIVQDEPASAGVEA